MEEIDPREGVKGKSDGCREEETKKSSKIQNPHLATGPLSPLDVHHRPSDEKA
jgi:hypothetical protein